MSTSGFKLNHSMLRVKDPQRSLHFYREILGATLIETFTFDNMGFSLYFLGFEAGLTDDIPADRAERINSWLGNRAY